MDFLASVYRSLENYKRYTRFVVETSELFDKINNELKHFPHGELWIERVNQNPVLATLPKPDVTSGLSGLNNPDEIRLFFRSNNGVFSERAGGWRQLADGSICVRFEGQEICCQRTDVLHGAMLELMSSAQFGNAIHSVLAKSALIVER
jgi:hypothetical protein